MSSTDSDGKLKLITPHVAAGASAVLNRTCLAVGRKYTGKVRDCYDVPSGDKLLLVTTDRLSAFDRVLACVPFKGECRS